MKKIKQEQGRSLVELLGVLAVIGVLTIGGIAGYNIAMTLYRANELLNGVNLLKKDLVLQLLDGRPHQKLTSTYNITHISGFPVSLFENTNGEVLIEVDNIPSIVCKKVLHGKDSDQRIFVAELKENDYFEGVWASSSNVSECDNHANISMLFTLHDKMLTDMGIGVSAATCVTSLDCTGSNSVCVEGACVSGD